MASRATEPGRGTAVRSAKPELAMRVLLTLTLAILPWWSASNRAAGLPSAHDLLVARFLSMEMDRYAYAQQIHFEDQRRFGTLAELLAAGYLDEDIEIRYRLAASTVTLFGESTVDTTHTMSARAGRFPWVRATVIMEGASASPSTTSMDWVEAASRFDALEIVVSVLGLLAAVASWKLYKRSPAWRWVAGIVSLLVLFNWLVSLGYRPLVPRFDGPMPVLGDSAWTWM